MPGWREETEVATWIAQGKCEANDRRTGLVSGLWYPLDVIDGKQRETGGEEREEGDEEEGRESFSLPGYVLNPTVSDLITFVRLIRLKET